METDEIQPPVPKPATQPSRPRALGRGLEALLPSAPPVPPAAPVEAIRHIPISQIDPNPHQPRQSFDPARLQELAESIQLHGVIQPIVVRPQGQRFLLIAGERRWRATSLAGIAAIPAIIRDVSDSEVLELTLIENIQREDLNPIETAQAFARLSSELRLTQDQIAVRTGKDRATVSNFLRLLKLPELVRRRIAIGEISMSHAKAISTLPTELAQKALAERIVEEGLSVRQTEKLVKLPPLPPLPPLPRLPSLPKGPTGDPNVEAAIQEMERALGTRVRLSGSETEGKLLIEYNSAEDLDRIWAWIMRKE